MRLDRATGDQLAKLPEITYDPNKISEKVGEDEQGQPFVALMFKHPPRAEVFLVVNDGQPPEAEEVDELILKMVIGEQVNN
ncbi:MAG: hypothetical protein IH865_11000 [Chloroflexi bacterium]|nr:hypothetical protein [Chloroflexota bacterium]